MTTSPLLFPQAPSREDSRTLFKTGRNKRKNGRIGRCAQVGTAYMVRIGWETSTGMFLFENREVDVTDL